LKLRWEKRQGIEWSVEKGPTATNKMSYVYRLAAREEIEITFESKRVL